MARDERTQAIFTTADDQIQGPWAMHRYLKAWEQFSNGRNGWFHRDVSLTVRSEGGCDASVSFSPPLEKLGELRREDACAAGKSTIYESRGEL